MPGVDWTGVMLGKSSRYSRLIPIILKDSGLYAELIRSIDDLQTHLEPACSEMILAELLKLRLHYANCNLTHQESKIILQDYICDLKLYPIDLIRSACIKYRISPESLFFPKIGQLIQLIAGPYHKRKWKLEKMTKLLEVSR
jgi:hypothetical protein